MAEVYSAYIEATSDDGNAADEPLPWDQGVRRALRLLVLTSSWPRFEGDYAGHFVREWVEQVHRHRVVPEHAHDNLRRLELHVFSRLGRLPIDGGTPPSRWIAAKRREGG
mgnify:CR=1 FL=1